MVCKLCPARKHCFDKGICENCAFGQAFEKLHKKVERLKAKNEALQAKTEWISVAERLPDCEYGSETEALLFRLKTGTVEAGYFGTGGRFRDKYFRCYHHASWGWDAKDVTHWMPLPEPPKGE